MQKSILPGYYSSELIKLEKDLQDQFNSVRSEQDDQHIDSKHEVFKLIAKDFDWEVAKVCHSLLSYLDWTYLTDLSLCDCLERVKERKERQRVE